MNTTKACEDLNLTVPVRETCHLTINGVLGLYSYRLKKLKLDTFNQIRKKTACDALTYTS